MSHPRDELLILLSGELQDILGIDDDERLAIEEAMQQYYNAGHDAGRAAERADVVAWLSPHASRSKCKCCALPWACGAIEQGFHIEEPE